MPRIRASVLSVVLLMAASPALAVEQPGPGEVAVVARHGRSVRGTVDGFPFLLLRGTHAERGRAHGALAAKEIVGLCDATAGFLRIGGQAAGRSDVSWERALQGLDRYTFPERFATEVAAMYEGIQEALPDAADRTLRSLGRQITLRDLMLLQTGEILEAMRCSQFAAWGRLTADGEVVVGRNWDYPPLFPPGFACILAIEPAEEGLSPTLDALWFGMIGSGLATINRDGVYLAGNDAGIDERGAAVPAPQPTTLLMRQVMETSKPERLLADFTATIEGHVSLGLLFHVANLPEGPDGRAVIVEYDPRPDGAGTQVRRIAATRLPDAIVVTNHCLAGGREGGGDSAARYRAITEALAALGQAGRTVGFAEANEIMGQVAKSAPLMSTLYTAVAWPGQRRMAVAIAPARGRPATAGPYVLVDWEQIFGIGE